MAIIAQYNLISDLKDSISGNSLDTNGFTESNLTYSNYGVSGFSTSLYATTLDSPFQQLNGSDFTIDVLVEFSADQISQAQLAEFQSQSKQLIFRSSFSDPTYEGWQDGASLDIDLSMSVNGQIYLTINDSVLMSTITTNEDSPNLITIVKKNNKITFFVNGNIGFAPNNFNITSIDLSGFTFSDIGILQIGYTDDPQNVEPLFPNCIPFYGKIKELTFQNEDVLELDTENLTPVIGFNPFFLENFGPNIINGEMGVGVGGIPNNCTGIYSTLYNNFNKLHRWFNSPATPELITETNFYSMNGETPFSFIGEKDFTIGITCTLQVGLPIQSIISYGFNGCETFCVKFLSNNILHFSGGVEITIDPSLIGTSITFTYARRNGYITIYINNTKIFADGEIINTTNYGKIGAFSIGQSYDPIITGNEAFSGTIESIQFYSKKGVESNSLGSSLYKKRKDNKFCLGGRVPDQFSNLLKGHFIASLSDSSGLKNDLEANTGTGLVPILIDENGINYLGKQVVHYPVVGQGYNPTYETKPNINTVNIKNFYSSPINNLISSDYVINFKVNFGTHPIQIMPTFYNDGQNTYGVSYTIINGGLLFSLCATDVDGIYQEVISAKLQTYATELRASCSQGSLTVYNFPTHFATNLVVSGSHQTEYFNLISSITDFYDGQDHEIAIIKQGKTYTLMIDGLDIEPDIVNLSPASYGLHAFQQTTETLEAIVTKGSLHNTYTASTDYQNSFYVNNSYDLLIGGSENSGADYYNYTTLNGVKIKEIRLVNHIDDISDWSLIEYTDVPPNTIEFSYCDTQTIPDGTTVIGGSGNSTDNNQSGNGTGGAGGVTVPVPPYIPPTPCSGDICTPYPPYPPTFPPGENMTKLAQTTLGKKLFVELNADPSSGSGYKAAIGSVALVDLSGVGKIYTKTGASDTDWTLGAGGSSGASQSYVDSADQALSGRIDTNSGNISTLNGQVSTLNGQVSTVNGQISTINGQISTLQSTSATTTYVDNNAAKKDLSNLSNVALATDLKPSTNEGSNLGVAGTRFNAIRAKTAYLADIQDSANIPIIDVATRTLKDSLGTTLFDFSTGVVSFNNKRITQIADPTSAQDGATKNYVDNKVAKGFQGVTFSNGTTTSATSRFVYVNGGSGTGIHYIQLPTNATLAIGTEYHIENVSTGVVVVLNSSGSQMGIIPRNFIGRLTSSDQSQGWAPSVEQLLESLISTKNITGSTVINWADSSNFYVETSTSTTFTFDPNVPIQNGQRITIIVKNTAGSGTISPTYGGVTGPAITFNTMAAITIMKINNVYVRVAVTNPAG